MTIFAIGAEINVKTDESKPQMIAATNVSPKVPIPPITITTSMEQGLICILVLEVIRVNTLLYTFTDVTADKRYSAGGLGHAFQWARKLEKYIK